MGEPKPSTRARAAKREPPQNKSILVYLVKSVYSLAPLPAPDRTRRGLVAHLVE